MERAVHSNPVVNVASSKLTHPALDFDPIVGASTVGIVDTKFHTWMVRCPGHGQPAVLLNAAAEHKKGDVWPEPYAYPGVADRWPSDDMRAFLNDPDAPTFSAVLTAVRGVLNEYVEFPRPDEADLIALWIVATYFQPVFPAFPRLNLHGEKGSAKSKVLEIIRSLAFNGLLMLNPTAPVLFRLIGPLRPTLCLDEMDNLAGDDHKALVAIINAGYKAGGTVPRCEGEDRRVVAFPVYAPIALAGIKGLNGVTADRSITVMMRPGCDPAKTNKDVDSLDPMFAAMRARLYRLALTRVGDVFKGRYRVSEIEWLNGRPRELYRPLLVLAAAAFVESDDRSFLDAWVRTASKQAGERERLSSDGQALFETLERWVRVSKDGTTVVKPAVLADTLRDHLNDRSFSGVQAGLLLKRYDFPRDLGRRGGSTYTVTYESLKERAERYGYVLLSQEPVQAGRDLPEDPWTRSLSSQ